VLGCKLVGTYVCVRGPSGKLPSVSVFMLASMLVPVTTAAMPRLRVQRVSDRVQWCDVRLLVSGHDNLLHIELVLDVRAQGCDVREPIPRQVRDGGGGNQVRAEEEQLYTLHPRTAK